MSHKPDTRTAQVVQHMRNGTPLANLLVSFRITFKLPDDNICHGTAIADCDARKLGNRAKVVVQELLVYGGMFLVEE